MGEAIRNSYEYSKGYSDGYKDGMNKAYEYFKDQILNKPTQILIKKEDVPNFLNITENR